MVSATSRQRVLSQCALVALHRIIVNEHVFKIDIAGEQVKIPCFKLKRQVQGRMNRRATIFHAGRAAGLNYAMPSYHLAHAVRDLVLTSWGVDLPPLQDKGEGNSR